MFTRPVVGVLLASAVWLGAARAQVPSPAAEPGSVPESQTAPAASSPRPRARISGGVMAGQRMGGSAPVYPPDAKAQGISGSVVMQAVIGKDGTVENLTVVSGNQILAEAAVAAVQAWTYRPYLLNGEPTEVDTTITVNFNLAPPAQGDGVQGSTAPDRGGPAWTAAGAPDDHLIRISSNVAQGLRLTSSPPVYPAIARAAHVSGSVVLRAVIGSDGRVQKLQVMSGAAMLQQAALDAVKTWTYQPYLLNGEPTAVDTTVVVNFNLAPPQPPLPVGRVRISSGVMAGLKTSGTSPRIPPDVRTSGGVVLHAIIGRDGSVQSRDGVRGSPELLAAVMDTVREWKYKPYLLNGEPVEVETTITMQW